MTLQERRRALMSIASGPSEWDSVWTYTDGKPTGGWTKVTTGGTDTITTAGLNLVGNRYEWQTGITDGVIEARLKTNTDHAAANLTRAIFRIGDSSNSVTIIFQSYNSNHRIRLYNNSAVQSGTNLGAFVLGEWYTIRLTISGTTGTVSVNGEVVADNVDASGMYSKGVPEFGSNGSYGGSVWEYVKIKDNSGV